MIKAFTFLILLILFIASRNEVWAREHRPAQIPNGMVNNCANCHVNPAGGGPRNSFGQTVEQGFLSWGDVVWSYALASLDSDGDGIPNGVELQDANALWFVGDPAPGFLDRVRNPGDENSFLGEVLTVQFNAMNPHVGQRFEIRIVDKSNQQEITRQKLAEIPAADFQIFFDGIEIGKSYWVDFYADHNNNGEYDPPSNDHAWRISVNNISGDTTVSFTHNTNFTDIQWPNLLTVNFAGMAPHLGQKFEARLVDKKTRSEIARRSIDTISNTEFSLMFPGIERNEDYWLDFYADFNSNDHYDAPPADHAWRMELEDVEGDTILHFQHSTNFTDVQWKYKLTLQLSNMTPHLGQMFEMRVIDLLTLKEVGREKIASIAMADFEVSVSGIDTAGYYQVDFYADHNGNGLYNSPSVDHAWRVKTEQTTGDAVIPFSHNTNFVDINWVYLYTLEASNMGPHLGQRFEIRIVDQDNGKEIGRNALDVVDVDEFTLSVPGILLNRTYNVDFYADHNSNGIYDAPPADHAWRITFNNGDDGDNEDSFSHNTNFTDIQWKYNFTLQFAAMNPHIGEMLEAHLYEQNTEDEIRSVRIDAIVNSEFSIAIPGIEIGGDYRIDFYADHNGNGSYDAPPTDHSWRETFSNSSGDIILNFTHNTNFMDIGLPTSIEPMSEQVPDDFSLAQNYPNPFNPTTNIKFSIPEAANVTLIVFNNLGQEVRRLIESRMSAGTYEVQWDSKDGFGFAMSSGVYFYQIRAGSFKQVKRMLLIK